MQRALTSNPSETVYVTDPSLVLDTLNAASSNGVTNGQMLIRVHIN